MEDKFGNGKEWCLPLGHTGSRDSIFFFIYIFSFFFSFIFISWKLITLQYCSGFCHTLT